MAHDMRINAANSKPDFHFDKLPLVSAICTSRDEDYEFNIMAMKRCLVCSSSSFICIAIDSLRYYQLCYSDFSDWPALLTVALRFRDEQLRAKNSKVSSPFNFSCQGLPKLEQSPVTQIKAYITRSLEKYISTSSATPFVSYLAHHTSYFTSTLRSFPLSSDSCYPAKHSQLREVIGFFANMLPISRPSAHEDLTYEVLCLDTLLLKANDILLCNKSKPAQLHGVLPHNPDSLVVVSFRLITVRGWNIPTDASGEPSVVDSDSIVAVYLTGTDTLQAYKHLGYNI